MADNNSKKYLSGDNLKYTLQQLKTKIDELYVSESEIFDTVSNEVAIPASDIQEQFNIFDGALNLVPGEIYTLVYNGKEYTDDCSANGVLSFEDLSNGLNMSIWDKHELNYLEDKNDYECVKTGADKFVITQMMTAADIVLKCGSKKIVKPALLSDMATKEYVDSKVAYHDVPISQGFNLNPGYIDLMGLETYKKYKLPKDFEMSGSLKIPLVLVNDDGTKFAVNNPGNTLGFTKLWDATIIVMAKASSQIMFYYDDINSGTLNISAKKTDGVWAVQKVTPMKLTASNEYPFTPTADYHPATKKYVDENKFSGDYNDLINVPVKKVEHVYVSITSKDDFTDVINSEAYQKRYALIPNFNIDESAKYFADIGTLSYDPSTSKWGNETFTTYPLEHTTITTEDGIECKALYGSNTYKEVYVVESADYILESFKYNSNDTNMTAIHISMIAANSIKLYSLDKKTLDPDLLPDTVATKEYVDDVIDSIDTDNLVITNSISMGRREHTTIGEKSVAVGSDVEASGSYSHAEGSETIASGEFSHAEGDSTTASGYASHAEGCKTKASEINSHAEGYHTIASSVSQHVQGEWNIEDAENTYVHIVGNGIADDNRSNAHTLDWDGNAWFAGDVHANNVPYCKEDVLLNVAYDDYEFAFRNTEPRNGMGRGPVLSPGTIGLIVGEEYIVEWNNERFLVTATQNSNTNPQLAFTMDFGENGKTEVEIIDMLTLSTPVVRLTYKHLNQVGIITDNLIVKKESINYLDSKFLPDTVATKEYVDTAVTIDEDELDAIIAEVYGPITYNIVYDNTISNYTTMSNTQMTVNSGESFVNHITADGYSFNIIVNMNGVNITDSVLSKTANNDATINIPSVTGDIEIVILGEK